MKRLVTLATTLALVAGAATLASAQTTWPPGPLGSGCNDTLSIANIQNPGASCHPALNDIVLGIAGIVTGFDPKPTGFAVYFQNSQGGAYTGIDAFTGGTNYQAAPYSLALGDSIVVYGRTQEFPATDGETEIEGPDGVTSSNDIVIRKVSSGNPLPPFQVLTPAQMSWIPTAPGAEGELWEGCLVKIRGPLRVMRSTAVPATAQLGMPSFSFLLAPAGDTTSVTARVLIDGNTLTTYGAPVVGTIVDSIQGIVNQRTQSGVNSYRIQIRDGSDASVQTPPNLVDAFPVADNVLRLVFDRPLDVTSASNPANYTLISGIDGSTVDAATVEAGGSSVLLNITSVRVDGDIETVNAINIASATCPGCLMTPQQSRTFVNGVLPIALIQTPRPEDLAIYDDRSPFAGPGSAFGPKLTFRGVCTGAYQNLYYMQDDTAVRSGVSVFAPSAPLVPGRQYLISGQIQEFNGETEVVSTVSIVDEGPAAIPAATVVPVAVLRDTAQNVGVGVGEEYECMLVKATYVRVTEPSFTFTGSQGFFVAGPAGVYGDSIEVFNLNGVLTGTTTPDSAMTIDVTGALHYAFGAFEICPRNAADIVEKGLNVGVPSGAPASLSLAVSPNPARVARLTFALPQKSDVDLAVFDLAGRKVAELARGSFGPGEHSRQWDGRDVNGARVGAGVYFYRLKVGGEVRNVRGVLIQ